MSRPIIDTHTNTCGMKVEYNEPEPLGQSLVVPGGNILSLSASVDICGHAREEEQNKLWGTWNEISTLEKNARNSS